MMTFRILLIKSIEIIYNYLDNQMSKRFLFMVDRFFLKKIKKKFLRVKIWIEMM